MVCIAILFVPSLSFSQPALEQPSEPDLSLASNLERQLLYSNRPSLFEAKPVGLSDVCVLVSGNDCV